MESSSSTITRLLITHLSLTNFKSYGGTKTIGPFHKRFNSVVGPNGSGKSNIIDAMLFVFGKRANSMRLKKLNELIHKSDLYPELEYASVEVHFMEVRDNIEEPDEFEVIPNSEFVLSRKVYKTGNSDYFLNNKRINWKEATDLLITKGIDLEHNRFLILQGEVEAISLMKPKSINNEDGMLEYLEDMIGSNKYVEDIELYSKNVDVLNESRQEKLNRVKLVEKEKDNIEGAKLEAEDYLNKEKDMNLSKLQLYLLFLLKEMLLADDIRLKTEHFDTKLKEEQAKIAEVQDSLNDTEATYNETKNAHKKLTDEMAKSKEDFADVERRDVKFRSDLKNEIAKEKKLAVTVVKENDKITELEEKISNMKLEQPQSQASIEKLTSKKADEDSKLESIFEELKGTTEALRNKLESKQHDLIPLSKDVNVKQSAVSVVESEIKLLEEKGSKNKDQVEVARREHRRIETDIKTKDMELNTITTEISNKNNQIEQFNSKYATLISNEEKLNAAAAESRDKLDSYRSKLASGSSGNKIVDALMAMKKQADFKGVYGRLGDLGTIDSKFDCAVTTAAPMLHHILVDNVETAQKCIAYLRANNLGKANFIALNVVESNTNIQSYESFPEDVSRLFDLIKCKDEFKVAFYMALKDTLVADNLDQASRIAYSPNKRWRVVTLDGNLIDAAGTMAGGGNQKFKGGLKLSGKSFIDADDEKEVRVTEDTISKQAKYIEDIVNQLQTCKNDKRALETSKFQVQKEIVKLEKEAKKITMELDSLKVALEESSARIKSAGPTELSSEDIQRIATLKTEAASLAKDLAKSKKNSAELEDEIKVLTQSIMDAGGAKLRMQKSKADEIAKLLDCEQQNFTKLGVDIAAAQKSIDKTLKSKKNSEAEHEESQKKVSTLKEQAKILEDEAIAVMKSYEDAQTLLNSKFSELEEITVEYERMNKSVDIINARIIEIEADRENFTKNLKDIEKKINSWNSKIKDATSKILEVFPEQVIPSIEYIESAENMQVDDEPIVSSKSKKSRNGVDDASLTPEILHRKRLHAQLENDREDFEHTVATMEAALSKMKPNMGAIEEFKRKEREYLARVQDLETITKERDDCRKTLEDLRKKRLDEFMAGFSTITLRLKEMYQMLTLGGDAELELVDSLDPFSEGIVFSVRPPKKSWKNIANLSGGEKTLSSLALVFALHHYKPTPLYVMDEIDAALDFKNVSIVANYIKERTRDAQFIIISLRNNMFEVADRLVGIYKTQHVSKSITINPQNFVEPNMVVENKENKNDSNVSISSTIKSHNSQILA